MSKNRQQRRTLRGPAVPVPTIVATDAVAVAPRPAVSAPEFPGLDDADTPIFDELWTDDLEVASAEAAELLAVPFESWGLDERAPLPVESMIKDLVAKVGEGTAWAIEMEVGQDAWHRRVLHLGEEEDDGQPDSGPDGDPVVVDGPEGPAVVGGDAPDREHPEGQG